MYSELDKEFEQLISVESFYQSFFYCAIAEGKISSLDIGEIVSLNENASVDEAIGFMQLYKIGSVAITNSKYKLVGIVTERDILMKVIGKIKNRKKCKLSSIMSPNPIALKKTDKLIFVMDNMYTGGFRHIPIIDDENEPIGMVSIKDVMSYLLGVFEKNINNTTCLPFREESLRESA